MPSQPLLLIEVTMTQTLRTAHDLVVLDLNARTVTALADEDEILGPLSLQWERALPARDCSVRSVVPEF